MSSTTSWPSVPSSTALRAGTVHVNQYNDDDITVPFGGYKQSGVGRDKSLHAFDKYTETKTIQILCIICAGYPGIIQDLPVIIPHPLLAMFCQKLLILRT